MGYRDEVRKLYWKTRNKYPRWPAQQCLRSARFDARFEQQRMVDFLPDKHCAYEESVEHKIGPYNVYIAFVHDSDTPFPEEGCCDGELRYIRSKDDLLKRERLINPRNYSGYYAYTPPEDVSEEVANSLTRRVDEFVNDEWWYVGCIIKVTREDECVGHDALWGLESDEMTHLRDHARSTVSFFIRGDRKHLKSLRLQERIKNRFRDAMECGV